MQRRIYITKLRQEKGFTLKEIGEHIGSPYRTVSNWEKLDQRIPEEKIQKIVALYYSTPVPSPEDIEFIRKKKARERGEKISAGLKSKYKEDKMYKETIFTKRNKSPFKVYTVHTRVQEISIYGRVGEETALLRFNSLLDLKRFEVKLNERMINDKPLLIEEEMIDTCEYLIWVKGECNGNKN